MAFDSVGQPLAEGDIVAIAVGNAMMPAVVKTITSGVGSNLAATDGKVAPAQPVVTLEVQFVKEVLPNQRIADAIKIGSVQKQSTIQP